MQLKITGHHIDVTSALNTYIHEKITRLKRHSDQLMKIHVILKVEKLDHKAEASMHVSGNHIFAEATHEDMYAAIDALADKLDRQVIKHKEKLKSHHRQEGAHRNIMV